jgi:type VI secretion system protein ImpK
MRKEISEIVYPVFAYALRVKEQLAQGESPNWQTAQAALKGLLKSDAEARRWGEYAGDPRASIGGRSDTSFFGIRYALVCWLDEIFILDSPWKGDWNENSLEVALYGSRDRAFKFWEQAKLAAARPEADALEVFFLCVMLGFRGELRGKPDKLKEWRESAEAQIAQNQSREWSSPPDRQLPTDVTPLGGAARMKNVVLAWALSLLVLIPAATFFLVTRLQLR